MNISLPFVCLSFLYLFIGISITIIGLVTYKDRKWTRAELAFSVVVVTLLWPCLVFAALVLKANENNPIS